MQKPGQNLLAKTSRSAYSYLSNRTVVANNRESELFTFESHGNSFDVTPSWVCSHSEYSMILWTFIFYFSFHTHNKKKNKKKPQNSTKPKQFSLTIKTI